MIMEAWLFCQARQCYDGTGARKSCDGEVLISHATRSNILAFMFDRGHCGRAQATDRHRGWACRWRSKRGAFKGK
jgi:hypothetical protein